MFSFRSCLLSTSLIVLFCFLLLLLIIVVDNCGGRRVSSHNTKGVVRERQRQRGPHIDSGNETTTEAAKEEEEKEVVVERQLMRWIRFMGGHSLFKPSAAAKINPYNYTTTTTTTTLTVNNNPSYDMDGDFTTIQDAIDSLPLINSVRVVIIVAAGTYIEKVSISAMRAFITIQGAGAEETLVQWGDTADTPGQRGLPLGTYGSATFAVNSPFFIAKNITFENTNPIPSGGAIGKQAVALRISADRASFVGCRFVGAQDTLYDHTGRHYYKDCYIEGSVDFIFGNALSLYEGCHLHAITDNIGAITAQNRMSVLEDTGFSFVNCKVTGSGALYLGRAWGLFSRVVFAYTYMDDIIIPSGWYNWGDPTREMTVFYGQYKCTGPGSNPIGRVTWSRELTDEEAKPFINLSFIDGTEWIQF